MNEPREDTHREDEPVIQRTLYLKLDKGNILDQLRQHAGTYIDTWEMNFGMETYDCTADRENIKLTFKSIRQRNQFRTHMDGRKSQTLRAKYIVTDPKELNRKTNDSPSYHKQVA